MYVHYGATFICQLPSCNLFTQHATYLYGETPLVNLWTPVHSFTLIIQSTVFPALSTAIIVLFYFTANRHHFPHYTFNPLFSARPVRLTTSLYRWGKVVWLCCVQVPRCCWHWWGVTTNVSGINLQIDPLPPTGRFNLGFILRERLAAVLIIIPSSWGFPTVVTTRASRISGAVAGEEEAFCKGSLSLSIFLLCFCFA